MHSRINELMTHLDVQRAILQATFDAVPPAVRDRAPAAGGWSVAGVIEHLAMIEERVAGMLAARISKARDEGIGEETADTPVLPTFNLSRVLDRSIRINAPDISHPTGLTADEAWAALERGSALLRGVLRDADGLRLGDILLQHPAFGALTVYEWVAVAGVHEARHAAQICEIAAAAQG